MSGAEALSLATVVTPKGPAPISENRPATPVAQDFSAYVSGLTEPEPFAAIAPKIDGDPESPAAGTSAFLLSTAHSASAGRSVSARERTEHIRDDGAATHFAAITLNEASRAGAGTNGAQSQSRDALDHPEELQLRQVQQFTEGKLRPPPPERSNHERLDASEAPVPVSGLDAPPDRFAFYRLPETAPSGNIAGAKTENLARFESTPLEAGAAPAPAAAKTLEQSATFAAAAPAQANSITREEIVFAGELANPADTANVPPQNNASDPEARASAPAPSLDAKAEKAGAEAQRLAAFEVASITKRRDGVLELRLDPPDLGAVSIRFFEDGAGAQHASISAEQRETLDLLRRNSDLLQRELLRNGAGEFILEFSDRPRSGNPSDDERKRPVIGFKDGERASLRAFSPTSIVIEDGGVDLIA